MENQVNLFAHRENMLWGQKKRQLPVTLVTGFLGAGKTTLLNHILNNKHNLRIAAAVNDFAERNIDAQIVKKNLGHGEVVELTNGCLCCSISSELKTAVWNLLQQADIGKIDYLMIETSGVTDPLSTIATLEQEYGKMYRIRLDAVITVVDTDALVDGLDSGREGESKLRSAAADSQLQCADVVLLNKRDLVSEEQLSLARDFISKLVPGAQVYACTKCAVPLHYLMEVREVGSRQVVSHEVVEAAYTISETGGSMNQERQHRLKEKGVAASFTHVEQDEFSSFVFESLRPFRLGAFQAFLGKNFPGGVTRIKGTVWLHENRSCLYSFHMSGRQRYELTPCASASESLVGAFSVQLVIIGRAIKPSEIQATLESSIVPEKTEDTYPLLAPAPAPAVVEAAKALVLADNRFELVASENVCIDFRLTGCIEYGVTVQEAESVHGINLGKMNLDLASRVNGSSFPVCLLPVLLPTGVQVCRYAAHVNAPFGDVWKLVTDIAGKLIVEYYRAVGYCKCGM
jgi:G3E family GTPase